MRAPRMVPMRKLAVVSRTVIPVWLRRVPSLRSRWKVCQMTEGWLVIKGSIRRRSAAISQARSRTSRRINWVATTVSLCRRIFFRYRACSRVWAPLAR